MTEANTPLEYLLVSPLHDRSGNEIMTRNDPPTPNPPSSYYITDPNLNSIRVTTDGATFTDTLGKTVLQTSGLGTPASPKKYQYYDSTGNLQTVTVNYTQETVRTNFGCSGDPEWGPYTENLLTSIELPDGTYDFTYGGERVSWRGKGVRYPFLLRERKGCQEGKGCQVPFSFAGEGVECGEWMSAALVRVPDTLSPCKLITSGCQRDTTPEKSPRSENH